MDDEIEIDFADGEEIQVVEESSAATEAAAVISDEPQAGVEELKRQLAEAEVNRRAALETAQRESIARQDAERRAIAAANATTQAQANATNSQYDSIVNALAASEQELANLQAVKATAMEKGDFGESAKIDAHMAKVSARSVNYEAAKIALEEQRKLSPAQPTQQQPQQPLQISPAQEQANFLSSLPAPSADWVRRHPQFFTDAAFKSKVMHTAAYAESVLGLNHNNPDYFRKIEEAVGLAATPVQTAPVSAAAQTKARASTSAPAVRPAPAATPTRSVPTTNSNVPGQRITLTKEEAEFARQQFPQHKPTDPDPLIIYAKRKMELLREGKIGPNAAQR